MGRRHRAPHSAAHPTVRAAVAAVKEMAGSIPRATVHDPDAVVTGVTLVTLVRGGDGREHTRVAFDAVLGVDAPLEDQQAYLVDVLERALAVAREPALLDEALAEARERHGHDRAA